MIEIVNESRPLNPFKGLHKVEVGKYDPVPPGCVTDGMGNVYEIPNSGYSKAVVLNSHTKVVYDFGRKELCYIQDGEIIDRINYDVINWFDSPEYAAKTFANDISERSEAEVQYDDFDIDDEES